MKEGFMAEVKGSQDQLQRLIRERSDVLSEHVFKTSHSLLMFGERVEWLSMPEGKTTESLLALFLEGAEIKLALRELKQFWPARGPIWDGLGIVQSSGSQRGLVLLEARSHVGELKSSLRVKSLESREKITARIIEVKAEVGSMSAVEVWTNRYYQMANRLCFLYFLNEQLGIPTWLVFCNFVNDVTHKSTSLAEWLQHERLVWHELGVDSDAMLIGRVVKVYPETVE